MLHVTRAQVFAIAGTEDLFLLLQMDPALEPKQRLLPVAGMWAVPHLNPKERERGGKPEGQVLTFSLHPTPLLSVGRKISTSSPYKIYLGTGLFRGNAANADGKISKWVISLSSCHTVSFQ